MEQKKGIFLGEKIFWLFLLGSLIGYVCEMLVVLVQEGHLESRQGLIYGPFTPVYGIGLIAFYLLFHKQKDKKKVFFLSMLAGGAIEYFLSYFQQKCFGTISWDYSKLWFNINGRTSLLHCCYWGIGGLLAFQYVFTFIDNLVEEYKLKKTFQWTSRVLIIFMAFNITISCLAAVRQEERMRKIKPNNKVQAFLDYYYPDERMDRIYANKMNKNE